MPINPEDGYINFETDTDENLVLEFDENNPRSIRRRNPQTFNSFIKKLFSCCKSNKRRQNSTNQRAQRPQSVDMQNRI